MRPLSVKQENIKGTDKTLNSARELRLNTYTRRNIRLDIQTMIRSYINIELSPTNYNNQPKTSICYLE